MLAPIALLATLAAAPPPATVTMQLPGWVARGSGASGEGADATLDGVASMSGIRNQRLLLTAANNRARAEIEKVLSILVASTIKSITPNLMYPDAPPPEVHPSPSDVTAWAKELARDVVLADHWRDPRDGTLWVRASLPVTALAPPAMDEKHAARFREAIRGAVAELRRTSEAPPARETFTVEASSIVAPEWVATQGGYRSTGLISAVGVAEGASDEARLQAESRALAELRKRWEKLLDAAGGSEPAPRQQVLDHWLDPTTRKVHALAEAQVEARPDSKLAKALERLSR